MEHSQPPALRSAGGRLALVMIVRDEARCIERCLQSARAHVDHMLVLDTGSRDDTVALARACGAEVHHMDWQASFAIARNRALELADADWNLVLDADEWIVAGGAALRGLVPTLNGPGVLRIDSHCEQGEVASHWITRLLPRGVRYAGTVHEEPVSALARRRLPVVVGHDGYLGNALELKRGRNRALLQAALQAAGGGEPYLLYQLGVDCEAYGERDAAADFYLQALECVSPDELYRPQLIVRAMHCLGKSGRLAQAMAMASESMDELAQSTNFYFTLGDLCLDGAVAHPEAAMAEWLPLAETAWLRCLALGECPEEDGRVVGRGSYWAAHNLHAIYAGAGDGVRSAHYQQLSERLRHEVMASGQGSPVRSPA
jgi:tetratricopeptide (TPR) repeat protein